MSISFQTKAVFLSVTLVLTACESDSTKLQRLNTDRAIACLNERASQGQYDSARYPGGMTKENIRAVPTPAAESLGRQWSDWRTKCELATRDLNRFMR